MHYLHIRRFYSVKIKNESELVNNMNITKYTYQDFKTRINELWQKYADKNAIVRLEPDGSRTSLKYAQLLKNAEILSKLLSEAGITRAERIAVIAPYSAQAAVLNVMLAYTGFTAVLIDAALPADERNRLLDYADVSAVFTTEEIHAFFNGNVLKSVPVFAINSDFSYSLFSDSIKCPAKITDEPLNEDIIAILFSSGTTGTVKGVQITYSSIIYAHKYMIKYTNLNSSATFLDVLPPNHIAGYSSVLSCVLTGTELGFISEVNAKALSNGFLQYKPTNFIMIPKIYEVIMNKVQDAIAKKPVPVRLYANFAMSLSGIVRRATGIKLRFLTKPVYKQALGENMKICGCGTAPCSEELMEFYLNLGIDFVDVYGSTETGFPIVAANCNEKYPIKGCGNINQFPEISVIIADPDENGAGEIRIKTPLIMGGYFKDAELTAASYDENGYFKTGDTGYVDSDGYLYVTGRIKESIVLPNGKKVSPGDVDNYYAGAVSGYDIACRGISVENGQYDEIHLFIGAGDLSDTKMNNAVSAFKQASNNAPAIYRLSGIHCIDEIPKTTVGKVKRFCLEVPDKPVVNNKTEITADCESIGDNVRHHIRKIARLGEQDILSDDMSLKKDIGMDSLEIFELCTVMNEEFGISIESTLDEKTTVASLIEAAETGESAQDAAVNNTEYPVKRTEKDYRFMERIHSLSEFLWNFEVRGLSNINPEEQYIFCPNHESLFDGIWIIGFLDRKIRRNIYSLAASQLFEKKLLRKGIIGMGGIPVYRSGNTVPAMKIADECLAVSGNSLLIHPEGTRSRSGEMDDFKQGAAQLAIKAGVKIVPVCIDGAYEVYPPNRKLPHLFNWKHFRKYKIKISFGNPIDTIGKDSAELTEELRERIVDMKNELK